MKARLYAFLLTVSMCSALAQDTLKVMSWNLLNYGDASRDQYYRTVIRHVKPDVVVVEEMTSQAMVDNFFNNVVNLVFPSQFAKGTFIDGPDTDNEIYYKSSKFTFVANTPIHTSLRNISEFKLYNPTANDTVRLYAVHLKASSGSSNEAQRAAEVDSVRRVTNALPTGKYFAIMGDFNIYGSTEQAYQKLLQDNPADDGHFVDALAMSGVWNDSAYRPHHTQSTRVRSFGSGATGGLDDRFDMILYSSAVSQPGKIKYLTNSLTPVGNDGNHYNDSINRLPNTAVPDSVANALHYASDHLPITARIVFSPGGMSFTITASAGANGSIIPNGLVSVGIGGSQTFTITPSTGYHVLDVLVDGVSTGAVGSYMFTNVTANHTISATFAINTYTITASAGANGSISPPGVTNVSYNGSQSYAITPNIGYHVSNVLVDGASVGAVTSHSFANVAANHTISATFAINIYTITASAGLNGSISPPGVTNVSHNGSQSYTITPNVGYHVTDVLVDGLSVGAVTSYNFANVTANHTISATFAINIYTITASAGVNGGISPSGVVTVDYGSNQPFTIVPDAGYRIADVAVDGNSVGPVGSYTFTFVDSNHSISTSFAPNEYTVTATAGLNGSISPSGVVAVSFGTNQVFLMAADAGYHVDSVLVDGNRVDSTLSYTFVSVSSSHTIRAAFAANVYSIAATAGAHGSIVPNGTISVYHGESQPFSIAPEAGCHVDSVVVDGVAVDSTTSYTFVNVTASHSIRTTFASDQFVIVASAGLHGNIAPSGSVTIPHGGSQTFAVNPDSGYNVDTLFVDDVPMPSALQYQFTNVVADHTIRVTFKSSSTVSRRISVNDLWNIVSVPLTVDDARASVLFPSAISSPYAFDPISGYIPRDTLTNGRGYWLKFPAAQSIEITGSTRDQDTLEVHAGWNIVGSISHPVPTASILELPSGIVVSNYFEYGGSYVPSDTIRVGKGYWTKASQNGRLVLH